MYNKRTSSSITPYKVPQSKILYNGARNDYPAFWNRFCQKLSEGIYYVLEPNYRRLTLVRIGTPIMVFEDNKPLVQLMELHANVNGMNIS
jgi:hypothetical protein